MARRIEIDALIIGAGPSGLTAAAWLAQCGRSALVIDKQPCHTKAGRADGIESRTFEILDSFGIGESIWAKANRTIESRVDSGLLQRDSVFANSLPGLSRYQESTLGQGEVEKHLQDLVSASETVDILRLASPYALDIDTDNLHDHSSHCLHVKLKLSHNTNVTTLPPGLSSVLQSNGPHNGAISGLDNDFFFIDVRARYLLGCDGARSWVRNQLGLSLQGDQTNEVWGVIDCIPITDFPDIRKRSIIRSGLGTLMVIPRERKLVRVYIQLSSCESPLPDKLQCEVITEAIRDALHPYSFSPKQVEWTTTYTVGQRLCKTLSVHDRIFLAGDAIHTHSPMAGQGMNTSIQDTYNLGWKLASVLHGVARPEILSTYQQERFPIAKRLIAFDKRIYAEMCPKPIQRDAKFRHCGEGEALQTVLDAENSTASGLAVTYSDNILILPPYQNPHNCHPENGNRIGNHRVTVSWNKSKLAKNITIGARLPSEQVLSQSDSRPWQLQQLFRSTGQWRLIVFGGDISQHSQLQRVNTLAAAISNDCYIQRLNYCQKDTVVGTVDIYLVHSAPRNEVDVMKLHQIFLPFDKEQGFDYGKIFADNESYHSGGGKAYENYKIAPEGCMVLLRPDQHVALLGSLEDMESLHKYLSVLVQG